jgi:hypothetical protein
MELSIYAGYVDGLYLMLVTVNKFPLSLTFASPLAKLNSAMDQELLQCFHASKVHMCSIKNSPPD